MKKIMSLMLAGIVVVGSFVGCNAKMPVNEKTTMEESIAEDKKASIYPMVITDQLGREVEIKEKPERIISSYYITSSLLIALGAEERVVGLEMKAKTREIYKLAAPEFLELPAIGSGKTLNVEESLALNPDLMIIPTRLKEFIPQLEELEIPVIAVEPESKEQFLECVRLVGQAIGEVERAEELVAYHEKVMELATTLTKDLENKPSVYIAGSSDVLRTCTSKMYQHGLIEMAGGVNASKELTDGYWVTISPEELLKWNPAYIYRVSYADYGIDAITEDEKYSTLEAVVNDDVYTFPSSIEPWDYPAPSSALGILWLMNNLHPDIYSEEDYIQEAENFYNYFYDISVGREALGL